MDQGRTKGFDGQTVFRWYVYVAWTNPDFHGGRLRRLVAWAPTAEDAKRKTEEHRPGVKVRRIAPAPYPGE